jgi:hypothetical protein
MRTISVEREPDPLPEHMDREPLSIIEGRAAEGDLGLDGRRRTMHLTWRLTWRDGLTTILAVLVVAVTLSAIRGWDWPLIGSDRSAVGVLGVLGYAMCYAAAVPKTFLSMKGGYRTVASVLGAAALVLVVAGLVWPGKTWIVVIAIDILALWGIATARHELRPIAAV